ncbi:uncharacterized protein HaLaN_15430, partial [Haematococcus lacustris]
MAPRLVPQWQVDAFTDVPFAGNPAAVCLLTEPLSEQLLQSIAAENNLAETAYIEPLQPGGSPVDISHFKEHDQFRLRWFTPVTEVPLCGHATLASAATLFQELHNQHSTLHFHTPSGVLSVSQSSPQPAADEEGAGGGQQARGMAMQMPLTPPTSALPAPFDNTPCQEGTEASGATAGAAVVVTALGSGRQFTGKAAQLLQACVGGAAIHEVLYAGDTMKYLMICLPPGTSQQQLEAIQPDFAAMLSCASVDHIRGVILTCRAVGCGRRPCHRQRTLRVGSLLGTAVGPAKCRRWRGPGLRCCSPSNHEGQTVLQARGPAHSASQGAGAGAGGRLCGAGRAGRG